MDVIDPDALLPERDAAWLRAMAGDAVAILVEDHPNADHDVRVRLVADDEMADAHQRYADVPGTTDVLTFDLSGDGRTLDVDIMVCVDEARRQGERLGHETRRELLLYIVHGVLHCLGHDDHHDDDYRRMHDAEDRVLERLGVGRTFAAETDGGVS